MSSYDNELAAAKKAATLAARLCQACPSPLSINPKPNQINEINHFGF